MFGGFGAVLGVILGHIVDQRFLSDFQSQRAQWTNRGNALIQEVFFRSTFTIMGYLAKSDGRVSEREIAAARKVMDELGLNESQRQNAINYFNIGKQPQFNPSRAINELRQVCLFQPNLLRTFLEFQLFIASAEGGISAQKRQALANICQQLGIQGFRFEDFEQQHRAEQNYQRHRQQSRVNPQQVITDAYEVLGISASASNDEVKKAYRRLMSKNHPDKLIAQGVPPEMVKLATQKTQKIMQAYESIKDSRGMS